MTKQFTHPRSVVVPVSHYSPESNTPLEQMREHYEGAPEQKYPASMRQFEVHPSPFNELVSSHYSPASRAPFGHVFALHQ